MNNMNTDDKTEILKEINRVEMEIHQSARQITITMIGVIVSIWAVTLITASTLYIITH